jgi:hypothetical protein
LKINTFIAAIGAGRESAVQSNVSSHSPSVRLVTSSRQVPEGRTVKNRLHLDFRPDDQDAEVSRLLALGARPADIGQGEQSWVVLRDPEGNEFCVLGARRR